MGNAGSDCKLIPTKGTATMASVNLATNKYEKKPDGITYDTKTSWHRLVFFGDKADQAMKAIHKGDIVYCEGEIKYMQYDNKDGIRQTATDIKVYDFTVVPSGKETSIRQEEPIAKVDVNEYEDEVPF